MKIKSLCPFKFRKGLLPKGESDFDLALLNSSERKYFDGLVKAKVVEVLPDAVLPAPEPPVPDPSQEEMPPAPAASVTVATTPVADVPRSAPSPNPKSRK